MSYVAGIAMPQSNRSLMGLFTKTLRAELAQHTVVVSDIDGVQAFMLEACMVALNAKFGTSYMPDKTRSYWFEKWLPQDQSDWMTEQFQKPEFYRCLAPDFAAIAALNALKRKGVVIWIASDRPANVMDATAEWCKNWRVPYDRMEMGDDAKAAVFSEATRTRPLLLIDDDDSKSKLITDEASQSLMIPRRPWTPEDVPGATIFDTWTDVLDLFGAVAQTSDVPQLGRRPTA